MDLEDSWPADGAVSRSCMLWDRLAGEVDLLDSIDEVALPALDEKRLDSREPLTTVGRGSDGPESAACEVGVSGGMVSVEPMWTSEARARLDRVNDSGSPWTVRHCCSLWQV